MRDWAIRSIGALFLLVMMAAAHSDARGFRAHLSGNEEVPPVASQAQGQAIFSILAGGTAIHYRLNVSNIENVLMAHIHLAPAGDNGDIVAWLYPSAPPAQLVPGRFNGVLAAGVITDASLVGPLDGQTLADLITVIEEGNAYVNVHTSANPTGEIRGQIR
jgi:hypothetical protein